MKINIAEHKLLVDELDEYMKKLIEILQYHSDKLLITRIRNAKNEDLAMGVLDEYEDFYPSRWKFYPIEWKRSVLIEWEKKLEKIRRNSFPKGGDLEIPERTPLVDKFLEHML